MCDICDAFNKKEFDADAVNKFLESLIDLRVIKEETKNDNKEDPCKWCLKTQSYCDNECDLNPDRTYDHKKSNIETNHDAFERGYNQAINEISKVISKISNMISELKI